MDIKKLLEQAYKPELRNVDGNSVYELWADGEVTLTKAGPLYGRRTVHRIAHPFLPRWVIENVEAQIAAVAGTECLPLLPADAVAIREQMAKELDAIIKYGNLQLA